MMNIIKQEQVFPTLLEHCTILSIFKKGKKGKITLITTEAYLESTSSEAFLIGSFLTTTMEKFTITSRTVMLVEGEEGI